MKKKTAPIFASLLILLSITGCETEVLSLDSQSGEVSSQETVTDSITNTAKTLFSTNLIAGQHHIAGKVSGEIIGDSLIVTYKTVSDSTASKLWDIKETHLYVGDCNAIPTTKAGNPKIGKFPLKEEHDAGATEFTYSIPVSTLEECFCIAAHAVVDCYNNESTESNTECGEETAWAQGTEFPGNSWAMYVETCNEPDPCSLAIELSEEYDGEGYTIAVDSDDETLSYKWSTDDTGSELYVFPIATTTYTVDVTDANGCTATASYTIEIPEPCSLTVELIEAYDGEGYTISVDTDDETLTYKWANGDTESEIYVSPNVTTTYTVDVTDANGCSASKSYTIEIQ